MLRIVPIMLILSIAAGCAPRIPKSALQLQPEALALRQQQTRRFETNDEAKVLSACAGLLQDLGYTISNSETELGVLLGTKTRKAQWEGEDTARLILCALSGAPYQAPGKDLLRASVVTYPVGENSVAVRVTFQKITFGQYGQVQKRKRIEDAETYQMFFDKLSKALFLEAHEL
jgi:hypothetical protein